MMSGLQGSGKTTTCGKLAAWLKKKGRSSMLAPPTCSAPPPSTQLEVLAKQVNDELAGRATVHFHGEPDKVAEYGKAVGVAVKVCQNALKQGEERRATC